MKKLGFTLAELLIALGIIGIIAILTVPTIYKNTFQKANIAKLQTTYGQLNDALKMMMLEERITHLEDSSLYEDPALFMDKYLKSTKYCENFTDCFASSYDTIDGSTGILGSVIPQHFSMGAYQLPNGSVIAFDSQGRKYVIMDVNGKDEPNTAGRDLFSLEINDKGELGASDSYASKSSQELLEDCKSTTDYGMPCFYLLQTNNWDANLY